MIQQKEKASILQLLRKEDFFQVCQNSLLNYFNVVKRDG